MNWEGFKMSRTYALKGTKRLILAALAILLAAPLAPSHAQTVAATTSEAADQALELGRQLARLTEARRQLAGLMPMVAHNVREIMTAGNPKVAKDFDETLPFIIGKILRKPGAFEEIVARAYAHNFTVAELQEMTAFYSSPTGRKLIEKQGALAQEVAQSSQPLGSEMGRELSDQMRKELRKRGHGI